MLSHVEDSLWALLLQRRVLEHLLPDKRLGPGELWPILKKVDRESRAAGPVSLAFSLVVERPSERLSSMKPWLEGLYSVRDCLAHRSGRVALVDVAPDRRRLELTADSDKLKATWLRGVMTEDGIPRTLPFKRDRGDIRFHFETYRREWSVGEVIHLTPEDVQGMSVAISLFALEVLRCFRTELDERVKSTAAMQQAGTSERSRGPT